jgi:hypothetical protein
MSAPEDVLRKLGTEQWFKPNGNGARAASRFALVPFDKIEIDKTGNYLVDGIIPRFGLVVLYGPPKSAKTFWALDLMLHVASGREYRGRRVCQGPVIYIACEGGSGYGKRIAAFRREKLDGIADGVPFYLLTQPANLIT